MSRKNYIFANHICVQIHFRHISLRKKKDPTQHCITYYLYSTAIHTLNNMCTCCMHVYRCYTDIRGMPITSIVTSRCNRIAKTNAFARISLCLFLYLSSFLPNFSTTIFSSFCFHLLFLVSVHNQWWMKAFWGPNIFCVIAQENEKSKWNLYETEGWILSFK